MASVILRFKLSIQICGVLGVGGTIWALSKTNYSHLTSSSTSAGVYMLMISVVLLLLSGVVGFVGVLRHNKPVMGSVSLRLFNRCQISTLTNNF